MKEAILKALQNAKKYIDAGDLNAAKQCINWVLEEIENPIQPSLEFDLSLMLTREEMEAFFFNPAEGGTDGSIINE
ncbi:MAG: hypothetical protein CL609_23680 [Anaerolineaceae bacterium]|nr:hypothetical protein [Anaerolineaceae bacterium]